MTNAELLAMLDELDALHAEATGGTWTWGKQGCLDGALIGRLGDPACSYELRSDAQYSYAACDANLTCALHNRWPALSAAVRELTAERDALQETLTTIEHAVAKVYVHITDGRISKCNTDPDQVIAVSDDVMADAMAALTAENERLRDENAAIITRVESFAAAHGFTF